MTDRSGSTPPPPRGRPDRPFPELSRHLRPTDEVYHPDSATWLRPSPSAQGTDGRRGGAARRGTGSASLPPRTRRKRRQPRGTAAKVGGVLLLFVVLVGLGVERLQGDTPNPSPTVTAAVATAAAPIVGMASPSPSPTPPATATARPPTATPTATPTLTPTATPDPRFVGKVVCLDPGHGGSDRSAVRAADAAAPAMEEPVYALAFAQALRPRLEADGFTVVMTRTEDVAVNAPGRDVNGDGQTGRNQRDPNLARRATLVDEIQARIDVCNVADASLLVSLHVNAFADPAAEGYETWYSGARLDADAGKLFAEILQDELGRQYAAAGYRAGDRGANNDDHANVDVGHGGFKHYLIIGPAQEGVVPSAMPGAIVEVGFLSNDADAAFIAGDAGQAAIVTAVEHAIVRYFVTVSEEFVYGAK